MRRSRNSIGHTYSLTRTKATTNVGQVCNLSGQVTNLSYKDARTARKFQTETLSSLHSNIIERKKGKFYDQATRFRLVESPLRNG